jgi:hypothetical protein
MGASCSDFFRGFQKFSAVDPNGASVKLLRGGKRVRDVAREDGRGQTVEGVVGKCASPKKVRRPFRDGRELF